MGLSPIATAAPFGNFGVMFLSMTGLPKSNRVTGPVEMTDTSNSAKTSKGRS